MLPSALTGHWQKRYQGNVSGIMQVTDHEDIEVRLDA
jgi:hypothetical protein